MSTDNARGPGSLVPIRRSPYSRAAITALLFLLAVTVSACGNAASETGSRGDSASQESGTAAEGGEGSGEQVEAVEPEDVLSEEERTGFEQSAGWEEPGTADATFKLTVPEMKRVKNATIPTRVPDEESLKNNVAVRLPSTGLPWEEEANVYIAGHELGYPSTDSFQAFYDLKKLEKGDEIYLTDADGREYTYEVFEILIIQPDDFWALDPLEGRNIVSLQGSETQQQVGDNIPKRVVRAELKDVEE